MKNKRLIFISLGFDLLVLIGILGWFAWSQQQPVATSTAAAAATALPTPTGIFDAGRALNDVKAQVDFGPRIPDSPAHQQVIEYIKLELKNAGWTGTVLQQEINGHTAYNILATRSSADPVFLLGAHYDSRIYADNDPIATNHTQAVPAANDGASGVAVLLGIARSLPTESAPTALLFIDIEDNGRIPGWDWIQGSKAFAATTKLEPKAVVILDMIGDADLNIFMEKNSDTELTNQIWKTAKTLGYASSFISNYKYQVLDDHMPFIERGFRAVDIIDLDYPYWHTIQDTPDKVSAASLQKVGDTMLAWIRDYGPCLKAQNCSTP
jgi:hypothetical protein